MKYHKIGTLRWLIGIVLACMCTHVSAQADFFNSDDFWKKISLDEKVDRSHYNERDTAIIIASSRVMQKDSLHFMGEVCGDSEVHFFFIYTYQNKWHAVKCRNPGEALRYFPINKDWVIYTEGMGKLFTTNIDRGMRMAGTYHVNVLLLDYPSEKPGYRLYHNYRFAMRNARAAYKYFVPVLSAFKEYKTHNVLGSGHLTLFFHSMGNNVVREMVKHGSMGAINKGVWVDNLVLNAPCVPQKHHKRWVDKIHFAREIYINYNPNDKTLKSAHLASFRKQLGEKVRKPLSSNATYINFDLVAGDRHSNFLNLAAHPPVIEKIIYHYNIQLHGGILLLDNENFYSSSTYRHIGWDIVPDAVK